MPTTELSPTDPRLLATAWLLISLFVGGVSSWVTVWRRYRQQEPWLDRCEEPRAAWAHLPERLALLLACLWLGLHLASKFIVASNGKSPELSNAGLIQVAVISGGTTLLLVALLVGNSRLSAGDFGLKWQPLASQLRDGWFGFKLAILPMAVTMALTTPLRTHDMQNPLLRLLADDPEYVTLALIVFIAAVIAPLSEELIFRVILQGSLTTVMPARLVIPIVAVAFSAVHGPVDGLALLPLALVLGSIFHRRHSYLAVVVIHGLFNATMLALALLTAS
ncbi:MAG: CPBP family intramembrane glutamic endopeptidase [Planctomycetota bacterium]